MDAEIQLGKGDGVADLNEAENKLSPVAEFVREFFQSRHPLMIEKPITGNDLKDSSVPSPIRSGQPSPEEIKIRCYAEHKSYDGLYSYFDINGNPYSEKKVLRYHDPFASIVQSLTDKGIKFDDDTLRKDIALGMAAGLPEETVREQCPLTWLGTYEPYLDYSGNKVERLRYSPFGQNQEAKVFFQNEYYKWAESHLAHSEEVKRGALRGRGPTVLTTQEKTEISHNAWERWLKENTGFPLADMDKARALWLSRSLDLAQKLAEALAENLKSDAFNKISNSESLAPAPIQETLLASLDIIENLILNPDEAALLLREKGLSENGISQVLTRIQIIRDRIGKTPAG